MGDLDTSLTLHMNICCGAMYVSYMKFDVLGGYLSER